MSPLFAYAGLTQTHCNYCEQISAVIALCLCNVHHMLRQQPSLHGLAQVVDNATVRTKKVVELLHVYLFSM